MFKILIKRNFEFKVPYELFLESQSDWTHFMHLHRKTHAEFRLLYKRGGREIFLYKARPFFLWPFPQTFIVFREYLAAGDGYRNIYLDTQTGQCHYLNGYAFRKGDSTVSIGEFLFSLPSFWRLFPSLFFWIFRQRGMKVFEEDNWWLAERLAAGNVPAHEVCAPEVPEGYDLYDDLYGAGRMPEPDVRFEESGHFDLQSRAEAIKAKATSK